MNIRKTSLLILLLTQLTCSFSISANSQHSGIQPVSESVMKSMRFINKWLLDNFLRTSRSVASTASHASSRVVAALSAAIPLGIAKAMLGRYSGSKGKTSGSVQPVSHSSSKNNADSVGRLPGTPNEILGKIPAEFAGIMNVMGEKMTPRLLRGAPAVKVPSAVRALSTSNGNKKPVNAAQSTIGRAVNIAKEIKTNLVNKVADEVSAVKTKTAIKIKDAKRALGNQVRNGLWNTACLTDSVKEIRQDVKEGVQSVKRQVRREFKQAKSGVQFAIKDKAEKVQKKIKLAQNLANSNAETLRSVAKKATKTNFLSRTVQGTLRVLGPNGIKMVAGVLEMCLPTVADALVNGAIRCMGGNSASKLTGRSTIKRPTASSQLTRRSFSTVARPGGRRLVNSVAQASRFVGRRGGVASRVTGLVGILFAAGFAHLLNR